MSWGSPNILFTLWIVPVTGLILWYAHRRQRRAALKFVDSLMLRRLVPTESNGRFWLRAGLMMLSVGLLTVAAARPRALAAAGTPRAPDAATGPSSRPHVRS